jgi:hypothetical protein
MRYTNLKVFLITLCAKSFGYKNMGQYKLQIPRLGRIGIQNQMKDNSIVFY